MCVKEVWLVQIGMVCLFMGKEPSGPGVAIRTAAATLGRDAGLGTIPSGAH